MGCVGWRFVRYPRNFDGESMAGVTYGKRCQRRVTVLIVIACSIVGAMFAPTRAVGAQSSDSAAVSTPRSTLDGVYTAAQALRGRDVYAGLCQSCHNVESHTGAPFRNNWAGRPLSDLFNFIVNQMPQNEPGSLTPEEYTLALAYMLRMNGLPAGSRALPSDVAQLDQIRVELPAPRPAGGTHR